MATLSLKHFVAFYRQLPAGVLLPASGLALALMLTAMRWVILRGEFQPGVAWQNAAILLNGVFQDWALALGLTLAALVIAQLVRAPRGRRVLAWLYLVLCLVVLLWGAANVVAVPLLGEPVTLIWVQYSDLANSRYALEALMHFVTAGLVLSLVALCLAFAGLTLVLARLLGGWRVKGSPLALRAAPYLLLLAAFLTAAQGVAPGKRDNAVIAFARSVFSETGLSPDAVLGRDVAVAPLRQLLPTAQPGKRPDVRPGQIRNVVFFVLESTPVKYSQGFAETYPVMPNLLKYSEQGRRFTRIYAHAPASNYALVSLLSAIVPELSPHSMTYTYPDLQNRAVAQVLAENGFRTGFFSSSDNRFQNTAGFAAQAGFGTIQDHKDWDCALDVYETEYEHLDTANDRCVVAPLSAWIDSDPEAPFFATIWTGMTHYPYFPGETPQAYAEDEDLNRYLNAVRVGDNALGEVIDALKARGMFENTLLVVVGDHGEAFGEHGNFVHASALYEENVHVPLVLINPALFSGGVTETLGGMSDIAPTVLDLLGLAVPDLWQGQSLFARNRADGVLFFAPWNGFQIGFRSGDSKYIFNANTGESWLFDLAADPEERNSLIEADPARAEKARGILAAWVAEQHRATDRLLRGAGEEQGEISAEARVNEVVLYATGTSYLTPPRAQLILDGETIGFIDITSAPGNSERAATPEEIDAGLDTYRLPVTVPECAKRLELHFLNDEWEGDGQTGDTNLYVHSVDLDGVRYYPSRFAVGPETAAGQRRNYFVLWKTGASWIDLNVSPECLTRGLADN